MKVGREPFDDELLLGHAALRLERVQVKAQPVRSGEHCHDRSHADDREVAHVGFVSGIRAIPGPHHELRDKGDAQPREPNDPAAVQVGPHGHHERKEGERAAPAAEVPVQPVELEAAEREGDHLGPRSPDRPARQRAECQPEADDHERLSPHLAVDQPEACPCDQAECDRQPHGAGGRIDHPHEDLRQVLVVGPDVVGDCEGEKVVRRKLAVLDHPAPDSEVPPEIGILEAFDEDHEDCQHHAADQQRLGAEPLRQARAAAQLRALRGLGAYRGTLLAYAGYSLGKARARTPSSHRMRSTSQTMK